MQILEYFLYGNGYNILFKLLIKRNVFIFLSFRFISGYNNIILFRFKCGISFLLSELYNSIS